MTRFILSLFLLLLTVTPAITSEKGTAPVRPGNFAAPAETEAYLLAAVNRIRAENGLPSLRKSEKLTDISRALSRDLARSGALSHTDSKGRDLGARIAASRIKGWRLIGENVGRSTGFRNDAEAIVSSWMKSPPHRKNILTRDYDYTGIGTARAKDGTLYAAQLFLGSTGASPDAR